MMPIRAPQNFKCHMDESEEVNFFFCRQYCMYYQGNTNKDEKNPWYGCFYDKEKDPFYKELFGREEK